MTLGRSASVGWFVAVDLSVGCESPVALGWSAAVGLSVFLGWKRLKRKHAPN